jgi:hypothetical protein
MKITNIFLAACVGSVTVVIVIFVGVFLFVLQANNESKSYGFTSSWTNIETRKTYCTKTTQSGVRLDGILDVHLDMHNQVLLDDLRKNQRKEKELCVRN